MADIKTTELNELDYLDITDDDVVNIVDVSDTTMATTGTNKKIKLNKLINKTGRVIVVSGVNEDTTIGTLAVNEIIDSYTVAASEDTDNSVNVFINFLGLSDNTYINSGMVKSKSIQDNKYTGGDVTVTSPTWSTTGSYIFKLYIRSII